MVKIKNYIEHLENLLMIRVYIYLVVWAGLINIVLSLDLEMQDVDFVSSSIDIDLAILLRACQNIEYLSYFTRSIFIQ